MLLLPAAAVVIVAAAAAAVAASLPPCEHDTLPTWSADRNSLFLAVAILLFITAGWLTDLLLLPLPSLYL